MNTGLKIAGAFVLGSAAAGVALLVLDDLFRDANDRVQLGMAAREYVDDIASRREQDRRHRSPLDSYDPDYMVEALKDSAPIGMRSLTDAPSRRRPIRVPLPDDPLLTRKTR